MHLKIFDTHWDWARKGLRHASLIISQASIYMTSFNSVHTFSTFDYHNFCRKTFVFAKKYLVLNLKFRKHVFPKRGWMFKILNEYKVTLTSLRDFSKVFSYILINIPETLILCPRCTIRNACRVIKNYFIREFIKKGF